MRRLRFLTILFLFLFLLSSLSFGQEERVYVIPIQGEINRATKNFLKNSLQEVEGEEVSAIIFEIDTYGGLIAEANDIKELIMSSNIPTISFVNKKAGSAGVLITIASEKVVMAPNAMIGSAEPNPNTEKVLSMWRSWLRDTANYRGRNSMIIEGMADKDIVVEGVSEAGKLINLTSQEALDLGIADYIAKDYREILEHFGYKDAELIKVDESLQIKLAKYISNPYLSSLLLTIAFVGFVVELFAPGFGLGGTISIMAFGLYFGGNILAGNSNWTSLALFILGIILLIIEMIIPGFGLPGISGILFVIIGVVLAMDSVLNAIFSISIAIIITALIAIILVKRGFESKLFKSIILTNDTTKEGGYVSFEVSEDLVAKRGIAVSELRPSGFVEVDGKRLDVLSDEGYIPKGTEVEISRIEGSKIYVRRV